MSPRCLNEDTSISFQDCELSLEATDSQKLENEHLSPNIDLASQHYTLVVTLMTLLAKVGLIFNYLIYCWVAHESGPHGD